MFTVNLKILDLSKKMEQYLEKEYSYLEKITKKPKEYHFEEALIRYINNEWGIRDDTEEYMKKDFKGRKRPHNYHIVEALFRYLEDMEDIRELGKRMKNKNTKYYTSEELNKRLGLNE